MCCIILSLLIMKSTVHIKILSREALNCAVVLMMMSHAFYINVEDDEQKSHLHLQTSEQQEATALNDFP